MDAIAIFLYLFGVITFVVSMIIDGPNRKALKSEEDHTGTKKSNHKVLIPIKVFAGIILFVPFVWAYKMVMNAIRYFLYPLGAWEPILEMGVILLIFLVIRATWKVISPESFLRLKVKNRVKNEKLWRSSFGGGVGALFYGAGLFLHGLEDPTFFTLCSFVTLAGLFGVWDGFIGRRRSREKEKLQTT